jgi:hypothetical protein
MESDIRCWWGMSWGAWHNRGLWNAGFKQEVGNVRATTASTVTWCSAGIRRQDNRLW